MGKWCSLIYVNASNVILGFFVYHSIGSFLFNPTPRYLNEWSLAEGNYFLWFWILSIARLFTFLLDHDPYDDPWEPTYRTQAALTSSWFLVQIGLIIAKVLLPTWSVWYGFLQVGMALTFLFFVVRKISVATDFRDALFSKRLYLQSAIFFAVISLFSYFSIGGELSALAKAHYFSWPILLALYLFNRFVSGGIRAVQPTQFSKSLVCLLWVFVQIGIASVRILLPQWAGWYGLMQIFHLLSLLLLAIWKYAARGEDFVLAKYLILLTAVLSYHSAAYFASDDAGEFETSNFINAIVWPWVFFFFGLAMYCLKYFNHQ